MPVAVSLFLSKVGENVMELKHRSWLSVPQITGLFWWTWLIRQMSFSTFTLQLFTNTVLVRQDRVPGSTEILVFQGHPDELCLLLPGTKTFLPLFAFSWPFLFIEILQESVIKRRVDSILGRHILVAQSLSHLAAFLYPLSNKNCSRHPKTFFFLFESDSLLSIVSYWILKGIKYT